ncbi:MAG: hypothetical protein HBSIN02_25130 [Bacteroidia bacterium]|nr:MAG: hypothetical protein HBSIN02_25130 [Bacteroidia bacterium]
MGYMYFVYIIQSQNDGSYYIGYSHDVSLRLQHHNDGWTTSTRAKAPWKLVYVREFSTKTDALKFEKHIKRMKSRKYIENLIHKAAEPGAQQ